MDQDSYGTSSFRYFYPKSMEVHVLNGLIYNISEVYIDDMLLFGKTDDAFIRNVKTVFQRCRKKM